MGGLSVVFCFFGVVPLALEVVGEERLGCRVRLGLLDFVMWAASLRYGIVAQLHALSRLRTQGMCVSSESPHISLEGLGSFTAALGAQSTPDPVRALRVGLAGCIGWWQSTIASINRLGNEAYRPVPHQTMNASRVSAHRFIDAIFTVPSVLRAACRIGAEYRGAAGERGCSIWPTKACPVTEAGADVTLAGSDLSKAF